jgi:hypothetical protein
MSLEKSGVKKITRDSNLLYSSAFCYFSKQKPCKEDQRGYQKRIISSMPLHTTI